MRKFIWITAFLIMLYSGAGAQVISVELKAGTGTYSMNDLKGLNRVIKEEIPFNTKLVADFPPFLNYTACIKVQVSNANFGLVYSFQTTGSRISGKDYSGEYYFDMTVNGHGPGVYSEIMFPSETRVNFSVFSVFGVLYSSLKMHEYLTVLDNDATDDNYRFKSRNLYFEPGFCLNYPVRSLKFGINAGYLIQFGNGSFRTSENSGSYLANPQTGDAVRPGWSGLRAELSVCFSFPGKSN
jgi:hypothetical protein